jgi:hypothetical protein
MQRKNNTTRQTTIQIHWKQQTRNDSTHLDLLDEVGCDVDDGAAPAIEAEDCVRQLNRLPRLNIGHLHRTGARPDCNVLSVK